MAVRCIHANINFYGATPADVTNLYTNYFTTALGLTKPTADAFKLCDKYAAVQFGVTLGPSNCMSSRVRFAFFAAYKNAGEEYPASFKVDKCGPIVVRARLAANFNVDCSTRQPGARAGLLAYDPKYGLAYGLVVGRGRLEVVWGRFKHLCLAYRAEQANQGCYRPCGKCYNPSYDCGCKSYDHGGKYYGSCKKWSVNKPCVETYSNFKKGCDLDSFTNFYLYANYKKARDCGTCPNNQSFLQWLGANNNVVAQNSDLVALYKQWMAGNSVNDLTTYTQWVNMLNTTNWKTKTADSKGRATVRRKTVKRWRECSPYTERDFLIVVSRRTKCVKFFYKCHKVYQLRVKKMGPCLRAGFGVFCFGPKQCRDCCGQKVCLNVKNFSVYVPCEKSVTDECSSESHHKSCDSSSSSSCCSTSSSSLYSNSGTASSSCSSSSSSCSSSSSSSSSCCSSDSSDSSCCTSSSSSSSSSSCGPCKRY